MTDKPDPMIEAMAKAIWSVSFPGADDNSWDGQGVSDETREGVRAEARAALDAQMKFISEAMQGDSGTSDGTARQADARIANKAIQVSGTEFSYYRPKE